MNLKEYLQTTNKKYIKVGSDKGNGGFVYCGTPDDVFEYLKGFDKEEKENLRITIRDTEARIKYLKDNDRFKELKDRRLEKFRSLKSKKDKKDYYNAETEEEFLEKLEIWCKKEIVKCEKYLEHHKNRLENYTNVLTREVVEIYPSITTNIYDYREEIVIFEGYETRGYWTLKEVLYGIKEG